MSTIFTKQEYLKKTRKRGPCYSRIEDQSQSLLTRLYHTIFGQNHLLTKKKLRTTSKVSSHLPTQSTIKKQFHQNQQTLQTLVSHLTQIEQNRNNNKNKNNHQQQQIDEISLTSQSKRYKQLSDDPSWFDVIRSDQTTNDAWSRIKRRLEPNQQKHILRALMIICANLIDVPLDKQTKF